jgi:sugar phosphate isomerase/epimerase
MKGTKSNALWTGFVVIAILGAAEVNGSEIPVECRIGGFAIGCQAWSFNQYSAAVAIEKDAEVGGKVIEFYPGQKLGTDAPGATVDHNASDATVENLKRKLLDSRVVAVNYGVVGLPNDENECRKVFVFAKKMGLYAITSEPDPAALDIIEKLTKEYDIRVAIHNHPKRDDDPGYRYWDPGYVLSLVKNRDKRLGSCADTGHWIRSGVKPLAALGILKGRIISCHLKDLNEFGPDAHDVPYGTGVAGVAAILDELKRQKFFGNVSIEYEHNWDRSVPEIAQCIGFVRGYGGVK